MEKTNPRETYNQMAKIYTEHAAHNAYNAFYERPAMFSLLGEINGLSILDVGCGDGTYMSICLQKGAKEVVGFDISEKMLELAYQRLGDQGQLHHASLDHNLTFLPPQHFDRIICPLMMHYVLDWEAAFFKLFQVLKPGGFLLFSTGHPSDDFRFSSTDNYFETELIKENWTTLNRIVKTYRRSLTETFRSFQSAGFVLDKLLEPQPIMTLKDKDPETYAKLMRFPSFICFRLHKP